MEGEGTHITDVNGKRYLDGLGGMWCVNVGYGRKEMAEAMAEQALLLPYANAFVDMSNAPAAELAGQAGATGAGSLNHVAFSTSGSCSNDTAIRLAHFYHARRGELRASTSSRGIVPLTVRPISRYRSATATATARRTSTISRIHPSPFRALSIPAARRDDGSQFTDFLVEEFKAKILEVGAKNIAAFIAEPIQGSGRGRTSARLFEAHELEVAKEDGILFIADEVVTALAGWDIGLRAMTCSGCSAGYHCVSKGLASGYPASAAPRFG